LHRADERGKILGKFVPLVNPQVRIPNFITGLTGIDDDMVRTAPLFEEIAEKIVEITEDAVFVAHHVTFVLFENLLHNFRTPPIKRIYVFDDNQNVSRLVEEIKIIPNLPVFV